MSKELTDELKQINKNKNSKASLSNSTNMFSSANDLLCENNSKQSIEFSKTIHSPPKCIYTFSTQLKSPCIKLNTTNTIISIHKHEQHQYEPIFLTSTFSRGLSIIRYEILEDLNNRGCIVFGASLDNENVKENIHKNENNTYCYYCNDGHISGFDKCKKYKNNARAKSGNIVDFIMDMDKAEIRLAIDKKEIGVLFENVSRPLTPFVELLGNPMYGGGNQSVQINLI